MSNEIGDFIKKSKFFEYDKSLALQKAKDFYQEALREHPNRSLYLEKKYLNMESLGRDRVVAVLELGGSIAKVALVEIKNNEYDVLFSHKKEFFEDIVYTPDILFGNLMKYLEEVIPPHFLVSLSELIFVFAYPFEHVKADDRFDGVSTKFTKERKEDGVVGLQIGKAFEEKLKENGFDKIKVHVFNDATISLMAVRTIEILERKTFDQHINIIIGTGFNIAYLKEEDDRVVLVNTEAGDAKLIPLSSFDIEMHESTMNPFSYETQGLIAGVGIGPVFEVMLKHAAKNHLIENEDYELVQKLKQDTGKIERSLTDPQSMYFDQKKLLEIYEQIIKRASDIVTILIQAARELSKDGKAGVLSCGSVFWKGLDYKPQVEKQLTEIDSNFELLHKEDAAILGSIAISTYLNM